MFRLAIIAGVVFTVLSSKSFASEPWMGPNWTKKFCDYWNSNLQTSMAEWAEYKKLVSGLIEIYRNT